MKTQFALDLLDEIIQALKTGSDTRACLKKYRDLKRGYKTNPDGSVSIPLTQKQWAVIDYEDLDRVLKYDWFAVKDKDNFYARAKINGKSVPLHKFILQEYKKTVDHIAHNTLDNRKSQLRIVTKTQSSQNRRGWRNKKSGSKYKGVYFDQKWRAAIKVNKKLIHIGRFDTEEKAARAYDKEARILHGKYAVLNFPDEK